MKHRYLDIEQPNQNEKNHKENEALRLEKEALIAFAKNEINKLLKNIPNEKERRGSRNLTNFNFYIALFDSIKELLAANNNTAINFNNDELLKHNQNSHHKTLAYLLNKLRSAMADKSFENQDEDKQNQIKTYCSQEFSDLLDTELYYGIVERLENATKHYNKFFITPKEENGGANNNKIDMLIEKSLDEQIKFLNDDIIKCLMELIKPTEAQSENIQENYLYNYLNKLRQIITKLSEKKDKLAIENIKDNHKNKNVLDQVKATAINRYIQIQKSEYNKVLAILKEQGNRELIKKFCESSSDPAFDEYIKELLIEQYKKINKEADGLEAVINDIKNLDAFNLLNYLQEIISDKIKENKKYSASQNISKDQELKNEAMLRDLYFLYRRIANEYITYHTPGKSHEDGYGLINPALFFENENKQVLSNVENILEQPGDNPMGIELDDTHGDKHSTHTATLANKQTQAQKYAKSLLELYAKRHVDHFNQNFSDNDLNNNIIPKELDITFNEYFSEYNGDYNSNWDSGDRGHAKQFIKNIKNSLAQPKLGTFEACLNAFYQQFSTFPSGDRRDYLKKEIYKPFRKVIELNKKSAELLDHYSANNASHSSYYRYYTHLVDKKIFDTAKKEMDSITVSLFSTISNVFTTKDDLKSSKIKNEITNALENLAQCKSIEDYLEIMTDLAGISTKLSQSWHASSYYYRSIILSAMQSIIKTHFKQTKGPKLLINIEQLRKAQFLFRICGDGSNFLTNNTTKLIDEILTLKIDKMSALTPDVNQIRLSPHKDTNAHSLPNYTNTSSESENRVKRFRETLLRKLTASTIADYAIFDGRIPMIDNSPLGKAVHKGTTLASTMAKAAGDIASASLLTTAGTMHADYQCKQKKAETSSAVHNRPDILFWFKCIDKFSLVLSQVYAAQIKEMSGVNDPERFAEFCQLRIDQGFGKNMKLPANFDPKNMDDWMEVMYSHLREGRKKLTLFGIDRYNCNGDQSWLPDTSFQNLLKYTKLQYTNKDQLQIIKIDDDFHLDEPKKYGVADLTFFKNSQNIVSGFNNNRLAIENENKRQTL